MARGRPREFDVELALDRALELFVENDLLALPVVDGPPGRVVGVVRRSDLVGEYLRRVHGPPPILGDCLPIVSAAVPDVQATELSHRHAAAAPEESVSDAAQAICADDLDAAHSTFLMMMSSSA